MSGEGAPTATARNSRAREFDKLFGALNTKKAVDPNFKLIPTATGDVPHAQPTAPSAPPAPAPEEKQHPPQQSVSSAQVYAECV